MSVRAILEHSNLDFFESLREEINDLADDVSFLELESEKTELENRINNILTIFQSRKSTAAQLNEAVSRLAEFRKILPAEQDKITGKISTIKRDFDKLVVFEIVEQANNENSIDNDVKKYLKQSISVIQPAEPVDPNDSSPLLVLFAKSNQPGIRVLAYDCLARGANPNLKNAAGATALHFLIYHSNNEEDIKLIQALVKAGADINARTLLGNTPAGLALKKDDSKIMELFLISGLSINSKSSEGNPICFELLGSKQVRSNFIVNYLSQHWNKIEDPLFRSQKGLSLVELALSKGDAEAAIIGLRNGIPLQLFCHDGAIQDAVYRDWKRIGGIKKDEGDALVLLLGQGYLPAFDKTFKRVPIIELASMTGEGTTVAKEILGDSVWNSLKEINDLLKEYSEQTGLLGKYQAAKKLQFLSRDTAENRVLWREIFHFLHPTLFSIQKIEAWLNQPQTKPDGFSFEEVSEYCLAKQKWDLVPILLESFGSAKKKYHRAGNPATGSIFNETGVFGSKIIPFEEAYSNIAMHFLEDNWPDQFTEEAEGKAEIIPIKLLQAKKVSASLGFHDKHEFSEVEKKALEQAGEFASTQEISQLALDATNTEKQYAYLLSLLEHLGVPKSFLERMRYQRGRLYLRRTNNVIFLEKMVGRLLPFSTKDRLKDELAANASLALMLAEEREKRYKDTIGKLENLKNSHFYKRLGMELAALLLAGPEPEIATEWIENNYSSQESSPPWLKAFYHYLSS